MPLEGRELHMAISEKETCPIHRDWHDEETDFKEKSVRYTEIRHMISHVKSRMRESRTSASVGVCASSARPLALNRKLMMDRRMEKEEAHIVMW